MHSDSRQFVRVAGWFETFHGEDIKQAAAVGLDQIMATCCQRSVTAARINLLEEGEPRANRPMVDANSF
jgi:hypothetical protein